MSCSSSTIVCQEVFDENSAPSEEEVKEYAWKIGINPDTEPHLLHYAREGLMQALPAQWKPCFDTNVQAWYYYNTTTRQSQWEHPLDDLYRSLIKKVRSESISSAGEDDSKTSAKEDLRSYEEPADPSVDATSRTMDSSKSTSLRKANIQLNPLKKFSQTEPMLSPLAVSKPKELPAKLTPYTSRTRMVEDSDTPRIDLTVRKDASTTGAIRKDYTSPVSKDSSPGFSPRIELSTSNLFRAELRPKKEIPSPTARIDIDKMTVVGPLRHDSCSRREKLQSAQEKHPRGMTGRGELTLTGGGSIFLKSKDKPELQSPGQNSATTPTPTECLDKQPSIEVISSQSRDDTMPKSILRDQKVASVHQLWDVDPRQMSVEEKQLWRRQELDEERKSVRFNLDKALDIHFTVSESDHSDQEGEVDADLGEKDEDDWNSDEEDLEEERIIVGMKASVPVQDASDGSDRDEMSPKIVDSIFPVDDRIETQVSRESSTKENMGSLFQKVDATNNSKSSGKLSEIYFPKEGMKNKITSNIFDDNSQLSDESSEDKYKEVFRVNRLKYEVAVKCQTTEVEDAEMKQNEDKFQSVESCVKGETVAGKDMTPMCVLKEPVQDVESMQREMAEAALLQREKMVQELSETLKQLEIEHERCKEATKAEFTLKEQENKQQLLIQLEERLLLFQSSIRTQQETQEASIREKMHAACEELAADHQEHLERVRVQYDTQLEQKRAALEQRLAEMENELMCKQKALEHERTALEEQLAEMELNLASKREALECEHTALETASTQQLEAMTRELEELNGEKLAGLRQELEVLQQAQLEELRAVLAADLEAEREELAARQQQELAAARQQADIEHRQACEQLRRSNEEELEELRAQHEAAMLELREKHLVFLEILRSQLQKEEELLRREHTERLDELRAKLGRELETERSRCRTNSELLDNTQQEQIDNTRMFEKLRCEKRLLEDKYRSLKEKYIRLKTDVKISIERRKKRDGGATTGSETERTTSYKTGKSSEVERLPSDAGRSRIDSDKRTKKYSPEGLVVMDNNNSSQNIASSAVGTASRTDDRQPSIVQEPKNLLGQLSPEGLDGVSSPPVVDSDNRSSSSSICQIRPPKSTGQGDGNVNSHRRRQLFGRLRPCSAVNRASNNNNNNSSSVDDLEEDYSPSLSPVENLRRQLQKLEDLEDQFPASTHTDTYLRYPFTDTGQFGSSEMEFFRHRIHLERDSVRRAKDFLRVQRSSFLSRQRELKQRQLDSSTTARNMLDQLYQEERELTDMEVSLHRTRGLLGEKIIRLRHLEQSLYRAAEQACPSSHGPEDQTLSDLSSHSGSSGFSSTELATDTGRVPMAHGDHYQESSEIIQSLENLNFEIREIWEVLHKQQESANIKPVVATSPLVCGDLAWPTLLVAAPSLSERVKALRQQAQQNLTAMAHFSPARPSPDPLLAERTHSLREWLRQARLDSAQL